MKRRSLGANEVSRRAFLTAGSTGLGLLGMGVGPGNGKPPSDFSASGESGITDEPPALRLAFQGRPTAEVIVPSRKTVLGVMAQERLANAVKAHAGVIPDLFPGDAGFPVRPERNTVVLGTPATTPLLAKWVDEHRVPLAGAGAEGYSIRTWKHPEGGCCLVLAANSDKGLFHGATHLTDYLLAANANSVGVPGTNLEAQPAIHLRGTYNLTCWGLAPRYTLDHWKKVIDAMAEDHMNFIYFWLAGLFRSKKFPESFIYPETPLTNDDIHSLIKYSQDRGIKFYLASGAFAWFGQDEVALYHPEAREIGQPYFCRTLAASRRLVEEYLSELYDTFPEADGMYLEIGCEGDYHCTGPLCQKPLDDFGSKQIGESELSFLREFSEKLWKRDPKLKFTWAIGYPEAHEWDVRYYEQIRQRMTDPRYFWMEARQNWRLPEAVGVQRPLNYFSRNILHWDQYYAMPLLDMRDRARRVVEAGITGYVVAYEPGFSSASIYNNQIPFPVDLLPYRLTRFAYKEFTWNPNLSWDGFKARALKKFFAPGMPDKLVDIMVTLREFMREGPASRHQLVSTLVRYDAEPAKAQVTSYGDLLRPRLAAMESEVNAQVREHQGPTPEGINLILTCIRDLRTAYHIA